MAAKVKKDSKGVITSWSGKCSTFGPPNEPAGTTASGVSSSEPGIALRSHETLGKNFTVILSYKGKQVQGVLKQTDWGPALWTGRDIDITGAGATLLGIDPKNFPTDTKCLAVLTTGKAGTKLKSGGGIDPGAAVGQGVSAVANAFGFGDLKDLFNVLTELVKALLDRGFWIRAGKILLGFILLIMGLVKLSQMLGAGKAVRGAKSAGKGASAAVKTVKKVPGPIGATAKVAEAAA